MPPSSEDIRPHIFLPLPSLDDVPSPAASREDRLKAIISNLDNQHHQVRLNIVNAAIRKHDADQNLLAKKDDDAMDIDRYGSDPPDSESNEAVMAKMFADMEAQLKEGAPDPCVPADGSLPPLPPGAQRAAPPPEIRAVKEVMDQLDFYDRSTKAAREHYAKALERMTGKPAKTTATVNTSVP